MRRAAGSRARPGRSRCGFYRGQGAGKEQLQPALIFFHGGGWVIGDLESHDQACRALANAARCIVVAVDYRLAPEHKFPPPSRTPSRRRAGLPTTLQRLGIDAKRLAVGGDSAGGNLAAVVALDARDRGGPPLALQILIYPATDMGIDRPSHIAPRRAAAAAPLDHAMVCRPNTCAMPRTRRIGARRRCARRSFRNLPPALVVTAGFDPLGDEGEAYAQALEAAGVPVTLERFGGQIHGFLNMGRIVADSGRLVSPAAPALNRAFKAA